MNIGERIKNRRKELHLSADYVAEKLNVSRSTVFRYENGDIDKVPITVINSLAEILSTTPEFIMGWDKQDNIVNQISDVVSSLSPQNQLKTFNFANKLLSEQNSIKKNVIPFSPHNKQQGTEVTIYGAVSAGTGEMLGDGVTSKRIYFGKIPHHDYALTVNGDSMQPMFDNGQIIFVKNVDEDMQFLDGQIVIAILNGESYIKKLRIMENCAQLISLNSKYDPIEVSADDDFKIKGKVIL